MMKALSIRQPWAWLVCAGIKDIENRSWLTKFRGRIYVHAPQKIDYLALPYLGGMYAGRLLSERDYNKIAVAGSKVMFTTGAIIGEVDITDCVWSQNVGLPATKSIWFRGTYGFVLANPVLYDKPIPCKGRQGFFNPEIESGA